MQRVRSQQVRNNFRTIQVQSVNETLPIIKKPFTFKIILNFDTSKTFYEIGLLIFAVSALSLIVQPSHLTVAILT